MPVLRFLIISAMMIFIFENAAWATEPCHGSSLCETFDRALGALVSGRPKLEGRALAPLNYISFQTRRLARPRIVWVNLNLLREMGIPVPPGGLTPELEAVLLKYLGYAQPFAGEPADAYLSEVHSESPVRYGGKYIATNMGGSRTSVQGVVQTKGGGRNDLVGDGDYGAHANGGLSIMAAIMEAIMGEVADFELPYGANRILAVIDTGSEAHPEGRGLLVRLDDLRPAHFMKAHYGQNVLMNNEDQRVQENLALLPGLLPQVPSSTQTRDPSIQLRTGLEELARRSARQYAAMYARRLYHGSFSASNIELNGATMDTSSMTSVKDFGPIRGSSETGAAGKAEFAEVKSLMMEDFLADIRSFAPAQLIRALPPTAYFLNIMDREYDRARKVEMISLTGIPTPEKLETTKAANDFGALLISIAQAGGKEEDLWELKSFKPTTTYSLEKILPLAAALYPDGVSKMDHGLASLLPARALRNRFIQLYGSVYNQAETLAARDKVTADAFHKFVSTKSSQVNKAQPQLFRPDLEPEILKTIRNARATMDYASVRRFIDARIESARRTFKDLPPYQVVLKYHDDQDTGVRSLDIYDAKMDTIFSVKQNIVSRDDLNLGGPTLKEFRLSTTCEEVLGI